MSRTQSVRGKQGEPFPLPFGPFVNGVNPVIKSLDLAWNQYISQRPSSSVRRTFGLWFGGNKLKGLLEVSGNLGG